MTASRFWKEGVFRTPFFAVSSDTTEDYVQTKQQDMAVGGFGGRNGVRKSVRFWSRIYIERVYITTNL